jgi:hypothetical protein
METRESSTLAFHEIVKGLLANAEILFNLIESGVNPVLIAVGEGVFLLNGVSEDALDLLIDANEFLGLVGEFLLHFFGVNEKILQELPGKLNLTRNEHDFGHGGEGLLPAVAFFLEGGKVAR